MKLLVIGVVGLVACLKTKLIWSGRKVLSTPLSLPLGDMMKSILLVVVVIALTVGCSSQRKDARKAELIREIEAIQEKIDQKRDFTSLFTAGPPKRPENLAKMEIKELEAVRASLQEINVSLDAVHNKLTQSTSNTLAITAITGAVERVNQKDLNGSSTTR